MDVGVASGTGLQQALLKPAIVSTAGWCSMRASTGGALCISPPPSPYLHTFLHAARIGIVEHTLGAYRPSSMVARP